MKKMSINQNPEKAKQIKEILQLKYNLFRHQQQVPLSFDDLLFEISQRPEKIFRNIFQLFADMVNYFVKELSFICLTISIASNASLFFNRSLFVTRL